MKDLRLSMVVKIANHRTQERHFPRWEGKAGMVKTPGCPRGPVSPYGKVARFRPNGPAQSSPGQSDGGGHADIAPPWESGEITPSPERGATK